MTYDAKIISAIGTKFAAVQNKPIVTVRSSTLKKDVRE